MSRVVSFSTDNEFADNLDNLVAKSGLVGFTRGLAVEVAEHNITANCV